MAQTTSEESACSVGDPGSVPRSGISPGEENGSQSSILAWKIPWMEEPGRHSPWGHKESDTTERLHFHFHFGLDVLLHAFAHSRDISQKDEMVVFKYNRFNVLITASFSLFHSMG